MTGIPVLSRTNYERILYKSWIILVLIFQGFFLTNLASAQSKDCSAVFHSYQSIEDPRRTYVEQLILRLQDQAKRNSVSLLKSKSVKDFVVVGGGPHGLSFTALLEQGNPEISGVVIDKGNGRSPIWNDAGDSFLVGPAVSHRLIGSAVQPGDLFAKESPRLPAFTIGMALQFLKSQLRAKQVHEDTVVAIRTNGNRERIQTQNGIEIDTDWVVLSTGLGRPQFKIDDKESVALVERIANSQVPNDQVPNIQYALDAWKRGTQSIRKNQDPLAPYRGKRLAVIGGGGGAKTEVKRQLNILNSNIPPNLQEALNPKTNGGPNLLHWIGIQVDGYYKPKKNLSPFIDSKRLMIHDSHAKRIFERTKIDGEKEYVIEISQRDGLIQEIVVDQVIIASGFLGPEASLPSGLSSSGEKPILDDVIVDTPDRGEIVVAKRVRNRNVLLVGTGAGIEVPPEELLSTRTPVSFASLGPRIRTAADFISTNLNYTNNKNIPTLRASPERNAPSIFEFHKYSSGIRVKDINTNLLRLRTAIARELGKFRYSSENIELEFSNERFGFQLKIFGFLENDAKRIYEEIKLNSELMSALQELMDQPAQKIRVSVKTRKDGRAEPEGIEIKF